MQAAIAGLTLGLFIALCFHCYPYHPQAKEVRIWRDEKSASIAEIFNIQSEEVDKPIEGIFMGN